MSKFVFLIFFNVLNRNKREKITDCFHQILLLLPASKLQATARHNSVSFGIRFVINPDSPTM